MNKILILALDALEYEIVTKFRMKTFLQQDYGKIDLAKYKMKLITPWLWSIIISGHVDTGITHFVTYESKLIRFAMKILTMPILYKRIEKIVETSRRKTGTKTGTAYMLYKRGIKIRPMGKEDLKVKTIFEKVPKAVPICIPGYNLWREQFMLDLLLPLTKCIGNKEMTQKRLRLQWMLEKKKKKILEELIRRDDWNLVMVHFYITDVVGHLYWNRPIMLIETYKIMSSWIAEWKKMIEKYHGDGVLTLIMSDHGMRRGMHTDHAFWSSNFRLKIKPTDLTDYAKIILAYHKKPSLIVE